MPPADPGTHYINLGMPAMQTPTDLQAQGGELRPDAVLIGWEKRVSPMAEQPAVGRNYCLARDDAGALWRVKIDVRSGGGRTVIVTATVVGRWGVLGTDEPSVLPRVIGSWIWEMQRAYLLSTNGYNWIYPFDPSVGPFTLSVVHMRSDLRGAAIEVFGSIPETGAGIGNWPGWACMFAARLEFGGHSVSGLSATATRVVDTWISNTSVNARLAGEQPELPMIQRTVIGIAYDAAGEMVVVDAEYTLGGGSAVRIGDFFGFAPWPEYSLGGPDIFEPGYAYSGISRVSQNTWLFGAPGVRHYAISPNRYNNSGFEFTSVSSVGVIVGPGVTRSFGSQSFKPWEWSFDPRSGDIVQGVRM